MIQPTVGRVAWYFPDAADGKHSGPFAAIVTHVWDERTVNLCAFNAEGTPRGICGVKLMQDGDASAGGEHAEWMPYQKGQAAKTEQLEKRVSEKAANDAQAPAQK